MNKSKGEKKDECLSKRPRFETLAPAASTECVFKGFHIYIFPTGIGSSRTKIFYNQISKLGGSVEDQISEKTTHVIVDEAITFEKIQKVLKLQQFPSSIKFIKTMWLSNCIRENDLIDTKDFEINTTESILDSNVNNIITSSDTKKTVIDTSYSTSLSQKNVTSTKDTEVMEDSFVCSIPSTSPHVYPNKYITDKLERFLDGGKAKSFRLVLLRKVMRDVCKKYIMFSDVFQMGVWPGRKNKSVLHSAGSTYEQVLAQMYKNTRDQWRAIGYEKAIVALKCHPKPITSWEEAKSLPGVGERLADKIYEIVQSGQLRKIEETCTGEKVAAINLFAKVWGIGPSTAEAFVQQGFYTLNDLATKAQLTKAQRIGIKYFQELQERMTRSEAYEIFCLVTKQVKIIDPQLSCEICGSYIRNRETCGDVDVLITHSDGKSHNGVLPKLVSLLHEAGLLTDNLVSQEENSGQKKYMGICKLPGENKIHRRIDIIVVPFAEYACALMHFTGSAHFNRSIRLLASRKNMSLSEHHLKAEVIRQGQEKVTPGRIIPTPTEQSIFEVLDLKYRPPWERDHFAIE